MTDMTDMTHFLTALSSAKKHIPQNDTSQNRKYYFSQF